MLHAHLKRMYILLFLSWVLYRCLDLFFILFFYIYFYFFIKQPQEHRGQCVRTLNPRLRCSSMLGGRGQYVWFVNVDAAKGQVRVTIWPIVRYDPLQNHVMPESRPSLLSRRGVTILSHAAEESAREGLCEPSVMILNPGAAHPSGSSKAGTAFRETGILWLRDWPCYYGNSLPSCVIHRPLLVGDVE